ncbi:MAG: FtsQ-type POTRA domain-containing protein [Clostridia bacterium]|nr:FtsQ-type POTRA domain-containing protein [Clostridia bacterium]
MKDKPNNEEKIIDLQSRRKSREKKKKHSKRRTLIILFFLAVIAVLMSPYFNVKWFDIKGMGVVAPTQIKSASGIALGQNMFRVNIKKCKDSIRKIPYIDDAKIYRHPKGGIIISVTERTPFGYIKNATGDLIIDKEGRVLEVAGKNYDYNGIVEIAGIKAGNLKAGTYLGENFSENLKLAVEIRSKLEENKIEDRVSSINVKNKNSITLVVDNDKTVLLGNVYRIEYKLAMLESAIASIAPSEKGTIDLRTEGQALFTPSE